MKSLLNVNVDILSGDFNYCKNHIESVYQVENFDITPADLFHASSKESYLDALQEKIANNADIGFSNLAIMYSNCSTFNLAIRLLVKRGILNKDLVSFTFIHKNGSESIIRVNSDGRFLHNVPHFDTIWDSMITEFV